MMERPAVRWLLVAILAIVIASLASLATRRALAPAPPSLWLDSDALTTEAGPLPSDLPVGDGVLMRFPWDGRPLNVGQRVDLEDPAGRPVAKAVQITAVEPGFITVDLPLTAADRADATQARVVAPQR